MNQVAIGSDIVKSEGIGTTAIASREIGTIQGMIFMARQFPRDEQAAKRRILNACNRKELARQAIYKYARGGSNIEGPSIRLAEVLAQSWGNIEYGVNELEQRDGESIVEAFAWDLETNTRQTKRFSVPHTRHTKAGSRKLTDPRDIYENNANQGARRLRACLLGVIPGDIIDAAVDACKRTAVSNTDVSTETIAKVIASFEPFGVFRHHIEARIQRNVDAIDAYYINELRTIYASLKDGMGEPSDYFDMDAKPKQAGLGKKADKPKKESKTTTIESDNSPKSEQHKEPEQGTDLAGMFDSDGAEAF